MSKWFKYRSMARTARRRALYEETFEMFSVNNLMGGLRQRQFVYFYGLHTHYLRLLINRTQSLISQLRDYSLIDLNYFTEMVKTKKFSFKMISMKESRYIGVRRALSFWHVKAFFITLIFSIESFSPPKSLSIRVSTCFFVFLFFLFGTVFEQLLDVINESLCKEPLKRKDDTENERHMSATQTAWKRGWGM